MTSVHELRLAGLLKEKIKIQELEQILDKDKKASAKLKKKIGSNAQEIGRRRKLLFQMI